MACITASPKIGTLKELLLLYLAITYFALFYRSHQDAFCLHVSSVCFEVFIDGIALIMSFTNYFLFCDISHKVITNKLNFDRMSEYTEEADKINVAQLT